MIKSFTSIYPDESVYSYLCRLYAHSGYVWHRGFANEVFERWNENPEYNFINTLNKQFRDTLESFIPFNKLILEHTLFTYYARFLPKENRIKAYEHAMTNKTYIHKYLPIPNGKKDYYLRYCPRCVEEDRHKNGECYFHIKHLIPSVHICSKHNCELVDTSIPNTKGRNVIIMPLEQIISQNGIDKAIEYDEDNINVRVAKYISEVISQPFNKDTDILVSDYLTIKLKDKYVSPRGEQRNLIEINKDMAEYFKELKTYTITKQRLAWIFRNNYYNPYDTILTAIFEGISPQDLCSYFGYSEPKHIAFDRKVRELREQGKNNSEIAGIMNVNHEVVRQILLGTYDRKKNSFVPYKWQKWDWETIDENCCKEFNRKVDCFISKNTNANINRRLVAELFGLKDKSLRNLPRLKQMIKDYNRNK